MEQLYDQYQESQKNLTKKELKEDSKESTAEKVKTEIKTEVLKKEGLVKGAIDIKHGSLNKDEQIDQERASGH